jgi:hypothetical protein
MNKAFVCLAGLAAMLSQSPAALANPNSTSWSSPGLNQTVPIDSLQLSPAAPAPLPNRELESDQLKIPSNAVEVPVGESDQKTAEIPPPPPVLTESPIPDPPSTSMAPARPTVPLPSQAPSAETQFATPIPTDLGVDFSLSRPVLPYPYQEVAPQPAQPAPPLKPPAQSASSTAEFTLADLFNGDSDSLVAVTVGNAEGTRTPNGKLTDGFYGHSDPGNGVWNLGTFSYQHGATSPQEADAKQLRRLRKQAEVIQEKAAARGMTLTLEETLNGIDLANQAPKAVLEPEGYVEWLAEAHQLGKHGMDAILWARVQSFFDPQTQKWNAPGLGNTPDRIMRDQQRRMQAIARALDAQNYHIAADARLRPQPISFRLPKWNLAGRMIHKVATLLDFF